jgi:hypothetical protein
VLQQLQHLAGVLPFVRLGPKGPDRRTAAGVEHPLLQGGGVGKATNDATKGIYLMDKLAFGRPPDRWITGLPGDAVEVEAEQGCTHPESGSGERRLAAGMATTDHDQVETFAGVWQGTGGMHQRRLSTEKIDPGIRPRHSIQTIDPGQGLNPHPMEWLGLMDEPNRLTPTLK